MAAAPNSLAEDVAELRSDVAALREDVIRRVDADRKAAWDETMAIWHALRDVHADMDRLRSADRWLTAGICVTAVTTAVAFFALGLRWEAIARRCADMLAGAGS